MFRVPTNAPTRIRKPYFSPTDRAVDPCLRPHFSVDDVKIFVPRARSNRRSAENTLRLVSALLAEFVIFAQTHNPPLPFYGDDSCIAIRKWIDAIRLRGHTVSAFGKYALKVYGDALRATSPLTHPGILIAAKNYLAKPTRRAELIPAAFLLALENHA